MNKTAAHLQAEELAKSTGERVYIYKEGNDYYIRTESEGADEDSTLVASKEANTGKTTFYVD